MKTLTFAFSLLLAPAVQASIIGDTIRIDWLFPDSTKVIATTGMIAPDVYSFAEGAIVAITDGQITIENMGSGWDGALFNGFVFTNLTNDPRFTSFSIVSETHPLAITPLTTFGSNFLSVNFAPTGEINSATGFNSIATFAFTTDNPTVPDHGNTALMIGLGLSAIALFRAKTTKHGRQLNRVNSR